MSLQGGEWHLLLACGLVTVNLSEIDSVTVGEMAFTPRLRVGSLDDGLDDGFSWWLVRGFIDGVSYVRLGSLT